MEKLLAKREQLVKELESLVINIEDVDAKVAEYKASLLKQLEEDNTKKADVIKMRIEFIDELIQEEVEEVEKKAQENVEEEQPALQINAFEPNDLVENAEENVDEVKTEEEKSFY